MESCVDLWTEIEEDLLRGQKLQGTVALKEVYMLLQSRELQNTFPLLCSIYGVAFQGRRVNSIVDGINAHPKELIIASKL